MTVVDVYVSVELATGRHRQTVGCLGLFVNCYDGTEQVFHPTSSLEDSRYDRCSEEFTYLFVVHIVATFLSFVEHIEGAHHSQVHVDELCGEIQVTFEVACVDDIDYYVRRFLNNLFSHIQFFWRIGG